MYVNGVALRVIRERTGFSLRQLAELTKLSHTAIYLMETSETREIRPANARRICKALGVPLAAIIDLHGGESDEEEAV